MIRSVHLPILGILAFLVGLPAVAFAQAPQAAAANPAMLVNALVAHDWQMALAIGIGLLGPIVRYVIKQEHWAPLHTAWATAIGTVLSAIAGAIVPLCAAHATWQAVGTTAATAALVCLFGMFNPSLRGAAAAALLLAFGLALPACNTPGGRAFSLTFKACEASQLPPELQQLKQGAVTALLDCHDAASCKASLTSLGTTEAITVGPSLLDCIVQAAVAALDTAAATPAEKQAVAPGAMKMLPSARMKLPLKAMALPSETLRAAAERGKAFLSESGGTAIQ